MLADLFDLRGYGLEPSDAALSEVVSQDRCGLCHAPPLDRNASRATTVAWLERYARDEAAGLQAALIRDGDEGDDDGRRTWESLRTRMSVDSELWPGYAIPVDLLATVVARLGPTLEAFAPDAFLTALCGRCSADAGAIEGLGARLIRDFVERRVQGNDRVARMQPSWVLVERFAAIVDDAAAGIALSA